MESYELFQQIFLHRDKKINHALVSKKTLEQIINKLVVSPIKLSFHPYPVFVAMDENFLEKKYMGEIINFDLSFCVYSEDGKVGFLQEQESSRALLLMSDIVNNFVECFNKLNFSFNNFTCEPKNNLVKINFAVQNNNINKLFGQLIAAIYLCDWVFFVRGLTVKKKYLNSQTHNIENMTQNLTKLLGLEKK